MSHDPFGGTPLAQIATLARAIVSSRLREGVISWVPATPSSHGKVSILGSPPGKAQTFQFARILELRASRRAARFSIRVTFRRERVNGASTLCRVPGCL